LTSDLKKSLNTYLSNWEIFTSLFSATFWIPSYIERGTRKQTGTVNSNLGKPLVLPVRLDGIESANPGARIGPVQRKDKLRFIEN